MRFFNANVDSPSQALYTYHQLQRSGIEEYTDSRMKFRLFLVLMGENGLGIIFGETVKKTVIETSVSLIWNVL